MIHYNLRLPEEMYRRLIEAAQRDRRSINSEILAMLEAQLEHVAREASPENEGEGR